MLQYRRFRFVLSLVFGLFVVLAFVATGCESKKLTAGNMWVRLPMKGKRVTAGYLSLVNQSSQKLILESASSPDFGRIELHTMKMENDIMKMQKLDKIEVPPGGTLELKPHGKHLMMFEPKRQLKEGDTVQVTLHFQGSGAGAKSSQKEKKEKGIKDMTLPLVVKKDY